MQATVSTAHYIITFYCSHKEELLSTNHISTVPYIILHRVRDTIHIVYKL